MPEASLSDILSIRFDFGVPLEDIFPPGDIHPRLKYLFGRALEAYKRSGSNIGPILRYEQGTIDERLALKNKLMLSIDYQRESEIYSSGTYFWVIRHFLGLLPLPLLPSYTKGIQFVWAKIADECRYVFNCHDNKEKHNLDCNIAQTLNMLPLENFYLLSVIVQFLRKISIQWVNRKPKFHRPSFAALSNYYCSSLFVRPFRPGYCEKDKQSPLLLYLVLRWQNILRYCTSISQSTYCTDLTNENSFFESKVYKKYSMYNKYLIDIGCQTSTDLLSIENNRAFFENDFPKKATETCNKDVYKLAYIEEVESVKQDSASDEDETLYKTAPEFTFNSIVDEENKHDWNNIVTQTTETVKKIEESYIYDDYETFKKEDFNQVGKNKVGSLMSRMSKYGLLNSSQKKPEIKCSTAKKDSSESENSYIKFPDVCTTDDSDDHSRCDDDKNRYSGGITIIDHQNKPKIPIAQELFMNNSPISVHNEDSTENLQADYSNKKGKRAYILKKLRMSLIFLRTLTPKKSTFKKIESKFKYYRINSGRSNSI